MNTAEARRKQLLESLLHTPDLRRKYQQQATFRSAIDVLVEVLPLHVKTMAEASDTVEFRREAMVEAINRTSGYGIGDWEWDRS